MKTVCCVLLIGILLLSNGCSMGLYGGVDSDLYYSNNNVITGKKVGDPWKSRGSGMSRNTTTTPKVGFKAFSPNNGD